MTFVVASCAFKIRRASRPARGKPVLISILLMFHALSNTAVSEKTPQIFRQDSSFSKEKRRAALDEILTPTLRWSIIRTIDICGTPVT